MRSTPGRVLPLISRRVRSPIGLMVAVWLVVAGPVLAATRTPEEFGAIGDGRADDQAALTQALAALKPGETLQLASGKRYTHSGKLTLSVADVRIDGNAATLIATDPGAATLLVGDAADRVTIRNLSFVVVGARARNNANFASSPLVIGRNSGFQGANLISTGSAGCGFFVFGARGFVLENLVVNRSWADGLHMTYGATDGLVINPSILRAGDDGVACVSYEQDLAPCERITVIRPHVRFSHARGVSIVGGSDITYLDIDVAQTRAAGAMIAAERGADFQSRQALRCQIRGGRVSRTNSGVAADESGPPDPGIDHGALFLFNARADAMTDCILSDLEVAAIGPGSPHDITRAIRHNGGRFVGCSIVRVLVDPGLASTATLVGGNHDGQVVGTDTWTDLRHR